MGIIIPVDPSDVPTSLTPLPESDAFDVILREATGPHVDKNEDEYISARFEVYEPSEWSGRIVMDNYIRLPGEVTPTMSGTERRMALEKGVRFAQFCACLKFKGGPDGVEISPGATGKILIASQEYPEGSGQMMAKVKTYLR